jgi:DNA-3-methyladenine glycosylase II
MPTSEPLYFSYGEREVDYLSARDPVLGAAISRIGHIYREVTPDLFQDLINSVVGQQISAKAGATIRARLHEELCGDNDSALLDPHVLATADPARIQACGLSWRKTEYVQGIAAAVDSGQINLDALPGLPDEEVVQALIKLKGVGRWTVEMLMIFCLQRPDILAFDDLAIQRGMLKLYHHRKITKPIFERHRRRYHPYASVASLYLWHIAGNQEWF